MFNDNNRVIDIVSRYMALFHQSWNQKLCLILYRSLHELCPGKLSGMHENCGEVDVGNRELGELSQRISEKASMSLCFTSQPSTLLFSAKTTAQVRLL